MRSLSSYHPRAIQPIQALPGVFEIEALLEDLLVPQPVQRIAHSPGREVSSFNNVLLCKQAAGFQHLVHQFCRRRQVFYLRYFEF